MHLCPCPLCVSHCPTERAVPHHNVASRDCSADFALPGHLLTWTSWAAFGFPPTTQTTPHTPGAAERGLSQLREAEAVQLLPGQLCPVILSSPSLVKLQHRPKGWLWLLSSSSRHLWAPLSPSVPVPSGVSAGVTNSVYSCQPQLLPTGVGFSVGRDGVHTGPIHKATWRGG